VKEELPAKGSNSIERPWLLPYNHWQELEVQTKTMTRRYYKLYDNHDTLERWYLDDPVDGFGVNFEPYVFCMGRHIDVASPIHIPLYQTGSPLDYTEFSTSKVPVVNERYAALLREWVPDDIQLIPAYIGEHQELHFVVNMLRIIRCIDEAASKHVEFWKPEDGRPEKIGGYRVIDELRIDPSKVQGVHLFRPWGWLVAIIVSEELKVAMESLGGIGPDFVEV